MNNKKTLVILEGIYSYWDGVDAEDTDFIRIYFLEKPKTVYEFMQEIEEERDDMYSRAIYIGSENYELVNSLGFGYVKDRYCSIIDFYHKNKTNEVKEDGADMDYVEIYNKNTSQFFKELDKEHGNENKFSDDEINKITDIFLKTCEIGTINSSGEHTYWDANDSKYRKISSYEGTHVYVGGRMPYNIERGIEVYKESDCKYKSYAIESIKEELYSYLKHEVYNKETFREFNSCYLELDLGFCWSDDDESIIQCLKNIDKYKEEENNSRELKASCDNVWDELLP